MLDTFYRQNYPIVYGYLLSLCADPHLADDLTAETFLKAIEKIHTYDPHYRPSTWLCTIGRNLYINHCKRQKQLLPLSDNLPCTSPSPETLYLQKETLQQLITVSEKLPPTQRQVLWMRWEGMSFRNIGLALDKTENWARVTYFRAKSKILQETEDEL